MIKRATRAPTKARARKVSAPLRQSNAVIRGADIAALVERVVARYSVLAEHKQLFAAKYVTHLPPEEELRRELERDRRIGEATAEEPRARKPATPKRPTRSKGRKT